MCQGFPLSHRKRVSLFPAKIYHVKLIYTCAHARTHSFARSKHANLKPFRHAEPSQQAAAAAGGDCHGDGRGYCDGDASKSAASKRRSSQSAAAAPGTMPCATWISPRTGCRPSSTCTGCTTAPCGPCRTPCGTFCSRRGFAGSATAETGSPPLRRRDSCRAPRSHR